MRLLGGWDVTAICVAVPYADRSAVRAAGSGRSEAGDLVVTRPRAEDAIAPAGDVIEVGGGNGIERRQRLAWSIKGASVQEYAPLIGDGDQAGPAGGCHAGAADGHPGAAVIRIVVGIINRDTGVRVGIERPRRESFGRW